MVDAVVCIPSFKRPLGLRKSLNSLVAQVTGVRFAVIVVDNDAIAQEATPVAQEFFTQEFFTQGLLQGAVILEPKQGNVQAINAVFAYALAKYPDTNHFLMMDDDEIAHPHWLENMVQAQIQTQAAIIGGPVNPVFEMQNTPLAKHPLFWSAFTASGFVERIYGSGNVLITRQVFEKLGVRPFDLAFNHLGGGDADFFLRAAQAGFTTYFKQEALIEEHVPSARTTKQWLMARCLRIGALNVLIEQKRMSKFMSFLKNFAWFGVAFKRSFAEYGRTKNWFIASHHIMIAFGRFLPFFNLLPKPYKA
jgi:GT2 family glycosyltransferase